jgi:hypothetical protein
VNQMKVFSSVVLTVVLQVAGTALIGLAVYGVRRLVWKDVVPGPVSRLRWIIGVFVALVAIELVVLLGLNSSIAVFLNGALAYFIAEEIKQQGPSKAKEERQL